MRGDTRPFQLSVPVTHASPAPHSLPTDTWATTWFGPTLSVTRVRSTPVRLVFAPGGGRVYCLGLKSMRRPGHKSAAFSHASRVYPCLTDRSARVMAGPSRQWVRGGFCVGCAIPARVLLPAPVLMFRGSPFETAPDFAQLNMPSCIFFYLPFPFWPFLLGLTMG